MIRLCAGIVLLFCAPHSWAQLPQPYGLVVTRTVEAQEPMKGLFMPAKCDGNGNIYFRSLDGQGARAAVRTLKKVSPEGKLMAKYSFVDSPELANLDAYDFAVSPDGRVFATGAAAEAIYLVEFNEEGTFKSKTRLEHLFRPTQLTALKDGEFFLISGVELDGGSEEKGFPSFAAIFDRSGRIAGKLTLRTKEEEPEGSKQSDRERDPELAGINTAVEFGIALTGEDGFAYLLRQTMPAVIYVVSPAGEVVRTLKVDLDRPYLKMLPQAMHLAQGRLLLMLADDKEKILQVVDSQTGEILEEYFPDATLGGALGCYNGKELVFLTTAKGKLQLTFAERGALVPPR